MEQDRVPSGETAQSPEFTQLFSKAKEEFDLLHLDNEREIKPGRMGLIISLKDVFVEFFRETGGDCFGIKFERPLGDTIYTFKRDGTVNLTGWVRESGDEYPVIQYTETLDKNSIVKQVPAKNLDLDELRTLVSFIENPIRGRYKIDALKRLPHEIQ